ncbi:hypothetical protein PR202_ga30925 [Eleusine coracana subsp. coracana]|uniref:Uncharacterized protein n=1 Tax=Eleusine coracana subsp. coracana TaxID=191504 RepID=A0AAV5DR08_ELECO|nr:hypothetical protein PR202_ga30925 [Eleusine coracana subsp. coracana]
MADVDAAPPPAEVAPEQQPPAVESVSAEQEEPVAGEIDLKRKLEEVEPATEANGAGEDAKRPRVDGEPDGAGVEQQDNESSVEVAAEDSKVAPTEGATGAERTVWLLLMEMHRRHEKPASESQPNCGRKLLPKLLSKKVMWQVLGRRRRVKLKCPIARYIVTPACSGLLNCSRNQQIVLVLVVSRIPPAQEEQIK